MNRARHIRNYDLHSWLGITLGLIVYVVCFSGSFALFDKEIKTWEDPALRIEVNDTPQAINQIYFDWLEETTNGSEPEFMRLDFPTEYAPFYKGYVRYHDENDEHVLEQQRWHPNTGEPIAPRGGGLSEWLLDFHRDFMWPDFLGGRTVGRSLVGVVGIVLMLSILSGIVAHTKIREEAYALRLKRSQRLKWQDSHKVVGLWGLPFFGMIAFTGAYLGVIVIVIQFVTVVAFKGDVQKLAMAAIGPTAQPTGEQVQMLSLDELREMRHPISEYRPHMVVMRNYGDAAAEFELFYKGSGTLRLNDVLLISGATGEPTKRSSTQNESTTARIVGAVAPLHYGTYGGVWLKILYFILGMSLAVVTALGSMMWIERRKHGNGGNRTTQFYERLGSFNTGIVMGLPLATLSIFYLDKLYFGEEALRIFATGWTFFSVWALGLLFACIRRNDYRTTRELLMLSGALAMGIPILNAIISGQWFFLQLSENGHTASAWVDVAALIGGISALIAGIAAPSKRLDKRTRKNRDHDGNSVEPNSKGISIPAE